MECIQLGATFLTETWMLLLSSLVLHKMFHCKRIESPSNFRLDEFNQIQ